MTIISLVKRGYMVRGLCFFSIFEIMASEGIKFLGIHPDKSIPGPACKVNQIDRDPIEDIDYQMSIWYSKSQAQAYRNDFRIIGNAIYSGLE